MTTATHSYKYWTHKGGHVNSVLGSQLLEAVAFFLQMLDHQAESSPLCQVCIGVGMHGCARSGLLGRTSTRSGLTLPCQLNKLLRQNSYEYAWNFHGGGGGGWAGVRSYCRSTNYSLICQKR